MRLRLFASTIAVTAIFSGAAFASDPVAEYTNDWSGFYVGVHAGYGFGDVEHSRSLCEEDACEDRGDLDDDFIDLGSDDFDDFEVGGSQSGDLNGYLGGVQAGANFVMGNGFLLGAEASFSLAAISSKLNSNEDDWDIGDGDGDENFDLVMEDKLENVGMAEVKLGYALDKFAFYIKGGMALGELTSDLNMVGESPDDEDFTLENSVSSWRTGWTVGAGMDVMVANNTSVGLSYNYIDYGSEHEASVGAAVDSDNEDGLAGIVEQDIELQQHMVKANLNYHF
jgi:outer membrane immunogenic protein